MHYLIALFLVLLSLFSWQFTKDQILESPSVIVHVGDELIVSDKNGSEFNLSREEHNNSSLLLPAFPQAQGGGAGSRGGRGGLVYCVTNLNDRGEGSLRYGLEKLSGARTIVFRVGGYIHLSYPIVVENDGFITIAGQSASGDGITLTTVQSKEPVLIFRNAHDIILRYIRIRKGGMLAQGQHGSGLVISRGGHDIIVDHCSVSWAGDDNINIWANKGGRGGLYNITIQNSISSEGLNYGHPATGLIAGGSANVNSMKNFSIHHNLFAHNKNRNPLLKVASGEIINNLIYDWSWWATGIGGGIEVDIIANRYKVGKSTRHKGRGEIVYKAYDPHAKNPNATGILGEPSIYFEQNIGLHNRDSTQDGWDKMIEAVNPHWGYPLINGKPRKQGLSQSYRRYVRRFSHFPVEVTPVEALESNLLGFGGVGASQRLNERGEWVFNRDLVDKRVIQSYYEGEGGLIYNVDDAGGWSIYQDGAYRYVLEAEFAQHLDKYQLNMGVPYRDSDRDGMPDVWEQKYHLDPHNNRDATMDRDGDGYENLEEFLNGTQP